jgi:hypothetical protein
MSLKAIDIQSIPRCIASVGGRTLRDELTQLDALADGGQPDGFLTEENFNLVRQTVPGLARFAAFRDLRTFIDRFIASQRCNEACLQESHSERREGACIAPPPPELPPMPLPPPQRPKRPRPKPPSPAAKAAPAPPPSSAVAQPPQRLRLHFDELPPETRDTFLAPPSTPARRADAPCDDEDLRLNALIKQDITPQGEAPLTVVQMPYGKLTIPPYLTLRRRLSDGSVILTTGRNVLGSFDVTVRIDGAIEFKNRTPFAWSKGSLGFSTYGIDDLIEIFRGTDYAAPGKLRFMEETRDEREAMAERARAARVGEAPSELSLRLNIIIASSRGWAEKRRLLFELWDECGGGTPLPADASSVDRALASAGIAARQLIVEFARTHFPKGSSVQYAPEELAALNARRFSESRLPFEPYCEHPAPNP